MNIFFRVRVNTKEGEEVYITGSSALVGKYDPDKAFKMNNAGQNSSGETLWEAHLQLDPLKERVFKYKYFIKGTDGVKTYEVGGGRRLALNSSTTKIESIDHWQEYTEEAPFLTDPFAHVFFGTTYSPYTQTHKRSNELIVRAVVPNVPPECRVVICGEGKKLGNWKPENGVKMARLKGLKWIASFSTEGCASEVWKYRLAIINDKTGESIFETLASDTPRQITVPAIGKNETVIVEHSQVKFPPIREKFAGCSIPVFSLRSEKSGGCGEIEDLRLLIDWAHKTGIKVLEILPINDSSTTFTGKDSSPYRNISSLGINPLYISALKVGELEDSQKNKEAEREMKSLNRRASVDYEDLYAFKKKYLKEIFAQNGKKDFAHPEFYKFINEHKDWLYGYALFCSLRDFYKTSDFACWEEFKTYSEDISVAFGNRTLSKTFASAHPVLSKLSWESVQLIHFNAQHHIWLQYHLFRQLDDIILYAHSKGIAIKGELQMRVLRHSVDCWKFPHLFKEGEEDGFAIFNWAEMEKERFMWWKKRMRLMSWYLDIYSISNEKICEDVDLPVYKKMIPQLLGSTNLMAWGNGWQMLRVLPLVCAESSKENTPYFSTVYTSTACSKTLRMWLGERNRTIEFKSGDKKQVFYDATGRECESEIKNILHNDSMFAVVSLQDWIGIDEKLRSRFPYSERICNPENKNQVWKYRMHITLESLLKADSLNNAISKLITESGR